MSRLGTSHAVASGAVMALVMGSWIMGGIRTTPDGPLLPGILALAVATVCAVISDALRRRPSMVGLGAIRPVVWAGVCGWALSCYLLLDHPASLRSGRPVLSSLGFALILTAPFVLYWIVFCLVSKIQGRGVIA